MDKTRKLSVNCGFACLVRDSQGTLDSYDRVSINCGRALISREVNAKLAAKGASINSGDIRIRDITGKLIQLDEEAVIHEGMNLEGLFVIARGDLLIQKDGVKEIARAEGVEVMGSVFYPDSADLSALVNVSGTKRPYPGESHVVLGNHTLESVLASSNGNKNIWVSGRLNALNEKALESLIENGITVRAATLLSYEGLYEKYRSALKSADTILVPDGCEIVKKINPGELALYGKRVFVENKIALEEKDIPALEELELIVVKGKATMPAAAVKIFRSKGKAKDYFIYEGRLVEINGNGQFSHSSLESSSQKDEKLTIQVNGRLVFDDDVTAGDVDCVAALSYNGMVLAPGPVNAALRSKVKTGNGFMGTASALEEMAGMRIKDLVAGADKPAEDSTNTSLNLGIYILA